MCERERESERESERRSEIGECERESVFGSVSKREVEYR